MLTLVAEGKTNAEVGERLFLGEKTVRNHVSAILEKLRLTNRNSIRFGGSRCERKCESPA